MYTSRDDDRRLNTYLTHVNVNIIIYIIFFFFFYSPSCTLRYVARRRDLLRATEQTESPIQYIRAEMMCPRIQIYTQGLWRQILAFTINQRNIVPSLLVACDFAYVCMCAVYVRYVCEGFGFFFVYHWFCFFYIPNKRIEKTRFNCIKYRIHASKYFFFLPYENLIKFFFTYLYGLRGRLSIT